MPEVLLLCEYAALNGAERSMLATLDGVQAAGFQVCVAGPERGPLALALDDRGVPLTPFECRDATGRRVGQAELRRELAEVIGRRQPALVHANSLSMGRLVGPVAHDLAVPSLGHLRDIVGLSRQAIADLNGHRRLLAVSEAVRTFHVAAGVDAGKTHVLYNGVDLAEFRPRAATGYLHEELGLPQGSRLAATIGQTGMRKGQDVLLEAAAILADERPDLHWLLIGRRHSEKDEAVRYEANLREAAEGRLGGRVHFLGLRNDVDRLLCELSVLVHPARQEPLGRVLLEAAAAGVAVVATDVGGTREIFPPESGSARLVPSDDAKALAGAVSAVLRDELLRARMAAAARHRAEEAFDSGAATARLVEHYRAVMG